MKNLSLKTIATVLAFISAGLIFVHGQQTRNTPSRVRNPKAERRVQTGFESDAVRTIQKTSPSESSEEMVRRIFGKGVIETSPGEDGLDAKARSFNWAFVNYPDGSHWDLGVYEFDDYFWLYVKDFYNAAGDRVKYDADPAAVQASPVSDSVTANEKPVIDPSTNLLGRNTTCAGLASYDNPYGCCYTSSNNTLANCVFAAWEFARAAWGYKPFSTSWGSPGTWSPNAAKEGYTVSSKPCLFCIAGNRTHVAFPVSFDGGGKLVVNEQNCGETYTRYNRTYSTNPFNYYIWKKNGQKISISGAQQPLYASTSSNSVWFRISQDYFNNYQARLLVTFPGGGRTVISSGYYYYLDKIFVPMVLGTRGTWKVQAFYPNGDYSNEYSFYVN